MSIIQSHYHECSPVGNIRSLTLGRICWEGRFWAWSESLNWAMDDESGDDEKDGLTSGMEMTLVDMSGENRRKMWKLVKFDIHYLLNRMSHQKIDVNKIKRGSQLSLPHGINKKNSNEKLKINWWAWYIHTYIYWQQRAEWPLTCCNGDIYR